MSVRVAVVGAGAAGISAAHRLRSDADVTVFEASDRPGGHARTVEVTDDGRTLGLDTAFVVYNEPHYPEVTRFFDHLGVATREHPGRFSFFDLDSPTAYVSEDFDLTAEQVRARYPAEFARLWEEATRFYRESPRDFIRKRTDCPLGEYLDRNGYSEEFKYGFVVLVSTAAWSVPADRVWDMPASTVVAFFLAHGAEGLGGRGVPWRTVTGGSVRYVRAAVEELRRCGNEVRLNAPVTGVQEREDGVAVRTDAGVEHFDYAVLATHADDALAVLERPTERQRRLEAVRYHRTKVDLHTDPAVMPADRSRWRSWNYGRVRRDDTQDSWVVYYLNELQGLTSEHDYFVTLDCPVPVDESRVIERFDYRHPIFTIDVRRMQPDIHSVNEGSRVKFAGSYFHSRRMGPDIVGSHEAAFDSGAAAAESVRRDAADRAVA
ncbi:NAD(P)/FAD-dependent oxidoreductase [Saccharopolyspora erythraea]|uniref:NAD(P)/FAD-dependent oxidoreductase n=1 Tax=Saccharopolyspora erythraea TaxID=1836 RepID=UPI00201399A6|nr:FAD-dependent oxidoreductase [Saccharopolyspora erythraea]